MGQYEQMGEYPRLIGLVRERHAAGDTPARIAERRKMLQAKALKRARTLFSRKPKAFVRNRWGPRSRSWSRPG